MNALIIVDLQNDFLPGGALPVPRGDEVIPLANELQQRFALVLATQDWHPADHGSFAPNHSGKKPGDRIILDGIEQILWPVHCVQDTHGAEFAPSFDTSRIARIFHKGIDPHILPPTGTHVVNIIQGGTEEHKLQTRLTIAASRWSSSS